MRARLLTILLALLASAQTCRQEEYTAEDYAADITEAWCEYMAECYPETHDDVDDCISTSGDDAVPDAGDRVDWEFDARAAKECVDDMKEMECPPEGEWAGFPAVCNDVYDCVGDYNCGDEPEDECAEDDDCPGAPVCDEECACTCPSDLPGSCDSDDDCDGEDEVCDWYSCTCVADTCREGYESGEEECHLDSQCERGFGQICDLQSCSCACSVELSVAECDTVDDDACGDVRSCDLATCDCRCDLSRGAGCESDDDCSGDEVCQLDSCTCTDSPSPCAAELSFLPGGLIYVTVGIGNTTTGSDGSSTTTSEGDTDVTCAAAAEMGEDDIDWVALLAEPDASLFEAADTGGAKGLGDGDHVVISLILAAPFAGDDATLHYQYGFVFDVDGDPGNNYVAHPSYPADFFADTDRWYQLVHDPASGWSLTVQEIVDGSPVDSPSAAQVVALDDTLTLLVPLSEVGTTGAVHYRISAFRHDGSWLAGTWNGDVVPPVADGLSTVD